MYSNVKITPPTSFKMDLIEQKTHYTYFDSIGRPAVIFYKGNAVEAHGQPIMVIIVKRFLLFLCTKTIHS